MITRITSKAAQEAQLNKVCELARNRNISELKLMVASGICINARCGIYTPVMLLAKQGEDAAVDILLNDFNVNRLDALIGYARGRHTKKVAQFLEESICLDNDRKEVEEGYRDGGHLDLLPEQTMEMADADLQVQKLACKGEFEQVAALIKKGANPTAAACGFAYGGYWELVNQHLKNGASLQEVTSWAAAGGHVEQVKELITLEGTQFSALAGYTIGWHIEQVNQFPQDETSITNIAEFYAFSGCIKGLNQMIAKGADRESVAWHFATMSKIYKTGLDNVPVLLAGINDKQLRELVAEKTLDDDTDSNRKKILAKAAKLNLLMTRNNINYRTAKVLITLSEDSYFWLTMDCKIFPPLVHQRIASSLIGLPEPETRELMTHAKGNLLRGQKEANTTKFQIGFFQNVQELTEADRKAEERYALRMKCGVPPATSINSSP